MTLRSLLDISTDLYDLADQIKELDGNDEAQAETVLAWFESLGAERDQKLDNYAAYISELEARASTRKAEAKRLSDRARIDENRAQFLKEKLRTFFESHNLRSIETPRYRLTLAKNGGKAPLIIDCPSTQLPESFQRQVIEADTEAIRAALDAGESLPFARLGNRGSSIRIK
jgi:hypothetical protein